MHDPAGVAHRALGDEVEQFAQHATLTLTMSIREPDDFVDEVVRLIHQVTGLSVRIQLRADVAPYYSTDPHVWDRLVGGPPA